MGKWNASVSYTHLPEAQGISPHDIYGIDVKDFREKVQGLAMTYPQSVS